MRTAILLLLLTVVAPTLQAADFIVDLDRQVDFSAVKTFALRRTTFQLNRPEISSSLVQANITNAVRAALVARGLTETSGNADVVVDWTVGGQRFAINEWGNAIPLDEVPGGRRLPPGNPWRGLPESFVEGMLVVDLTAQSTGLLIWRGVYRNRESGSGQYAHQLPAYATKLLASYPRGKK